MKSRSRPARRRPKRFRASSLRSRRCSARDSSKKASAARRRPRHGSIRARRRARGASICGFAASCARGKRARPRRITTSRRARASSSWWVNAIKPRSVSSRSAAWRRVPARAPPPNATSSRPPKCFDRLARSAISKRSGTRNGGDAHARERRIRRLTCRRRRRARAPSRRCRDPAGAARTRAHVRIHRGDLGRHRGGVRGARRRRRPADRAHGRRRGRRAHGGAPRTARAARYGAGSIVVEKIGREPDGTRSSRRRVGPSVRASPDAAASG